MRKLACVVLTLFVTAAFAAPESFKDPLDRPALTLKRHITTNYMNAVTRAGERLVAVGIRGLVIYSDDAGQQWKQAPVPVSSDLTGVHFPTPKDGWVVGMDGVVLHSRDGGNTWEKQLDGRVTKKLLTDHFEALVKGGNTEAQRHLQDTQLNYEGGPEQALLSVWFSDAQHGFVCGSFGTLLATHDGGATWESWVEKVDAEITFHYYAIRGTKQGVMIASEKGTVYRLDPDKQRFIPMATGYAGTLFSLVETGDSVLAVGLLGNAYRLKGGSKQWEKIDTGANNSITAGAQLPDGAALLVTLSGQVLVTRDGGDHFQKLPIALPMAFAGVAPAGAGKAVAVGSRGVIAIPVQ